MYFVVTSFVTAIEEIFSCNFDESVNLNEYCGGSLMLNQRYIGVVLSKGSALSPTTDITSISNKFKLV